MSLVTDVIAGVRTYLPDGAERYSDSFLTSLAHAADCVIKDECETLWDDYSFSLYPGVSYYDVPEDVIAVRNVRFSKDGSTFNDGVLTGTSFNDLDNFDIRWKQRRGVEPSHYMLLSAPGVPTDTGPGETGYSKILIWRPLSAVTTQKIKLEYLAYFTSADHLSFLVQEERAEVIDAAYVPYIMAAIYANVSVEQYVQWWQKYREGVRKTRSIYLSKYAEGRGSMRGSGPSVGDGQLS